jgi:coenzyme F420-0:L-glutamate ligase/coenzyme F420-1:gamma-L-glutamate ligase
MGQDLEGYQPLVMRPVQGLPLISEGDNLADLIAEVLLENQLQLQAGDVLVIAQKIVSKAEGRLVDLREISPTQEAQELARKTGKDPREVECILRESKSVLRTRPGLIVVEHNLGFICANAGIDHSNVPAQDGDHSHWVLLLPENPDRSAAKLRKQLEEKARSQLGVVIIDSHGRAWREGTVGISIGYSGIPGLVDLRGRKDLFDYQLRITQIAAVDELAAGASLLMGQAAEGIPVVHVRGFPYPLREGSFQELPRKPEEDLFR